MAPACVEHVAADGTWECEGNGCRLAKPMGAQFLECTVLVIRRALGDGLMSLAIGAAIVRTGERSVPTLSFTGQKSWCGSLPRVARWALRLLSTRDDRKGRDDDLIVLLIVS